MVMVIFIMLVDLMHWRPSWTARYPPGPVPLPEWCSLLQEDLENMLPSLYEVRDMMVEGSRGMVRLAARGAEATSVQEERLRLLCFLREGTAGLRTLSLPRTKTWQHNGRELVQDVTARLGLVR